MEIKCFKGTKSVLRGPSCIIHKKNPQHSRQANRCKTMLKFAIYVKTGTNQYVKSIRVCLKAALSATLPYIA